MKKTGDPIERKVILNRFYQLSVKPYTDACAIPAKCDMCDSYEIEGYYARPFSDVVQVTARPRQEILATKEERLEQALTAQAKGRVKRTYRQQQKAGRQSAETVIFRRRKFGLAVPEKDYSGLLVADLKKKLKKRRLKVGGTKPELIGRLKDYDLLRGDFEMEKAPDIQAIARQTFEEKRAKRSAFEKRKRSQMTLKPSTGMFVSDPMSRTGVTQIRRRTEQRPFVRIPKYSESDIKGIQEAVKELDKTNYKTMTVVKLRKELKSRGLKVSGTKKELIKRLS